MLDQLSNGLSQLFSEYVHWCVTAPMWQLKTAFGIIVGGFVLYIAMKLFLQHRRRKSVQFNTLVDVDVPVNSFNHYADNRN